MEGDCIGIGRGAGGMTMSNVGKLIGLTRQVKGRSLGELATLTGRSEAHLQHIENGMLMGTPATLLALAERLNIDAEVLRDAYLQDAVEAASRLWNQRK